MLVLWHILPTLGTFYDHSVYVVVIGIFPSFGMMNQEKSGSPEQNRLAALFRFL
jgi:hypothetical protein